MKKTRLMALLLAMLMTLSLSACGNSSKTTESSSASPAASAAADNKLVIWTNLTADAQVKVLQKQFDEVAKELGVQYELVTVSFNDMYAKMATAAQSGTSPDIMYTNFAGAAYLQGQNQIVKMDDVIDKIGRSDFLPSYLSVLTADNATWGVPDWALHTSVWYRKDLFEQNGLKIPTTWAEFEADAKALNTDTNNDGKTDIYGFAVPMNPVQVAPQTYYEFLYAAGVYTFDPSTGEYTFGKDKEKAAQVLDYVTDLYKNASPPSATDWSWNEYRNALVEGTVAMTLDMGAVIGLAKSNNPDMVKNLGCFDLPGENGAAPASFGSGYCIVASSKGTDAKIQLEKDFITKLYTPELAAERALSRPMFAFPTMNSALEIYKKDSSVADFQTQIDSIYNAFQNSKWYWYGMEHGLSQMSSQIESTTFFGEAMQSVALGKETSAQAVDYIDQQLQDQIALIKK
jgi:ABC-type glycerol-3-phosphate transport system substrate-binding protein